MKEKAKAHFLFPRKATIKAVLYSWLPSFCRYFSAALHICFAWSNHPPSHGSNECHCRLNVMPIWKGLKTVILVQTGNIGLSLQALSPLSVKTVEKLKNPNYVSRAKFFFLKILLWITVIVLPEIFYIQNGSPFQRMVDVFHNKNVALMTLI